MVGKILLPKKSIKSACADGLGIVEKFVSEGKVKRYVETRRNSFFDKLGEILRGPFLIAPQEKNDLEKNQKLIQPVIDVLNYSQKNDATWDVFINKYKKLMTDQTLPRVTVDSLKKYEKYLVNCITEILKSSEWIGGANVVYTIQRICVQNGTDGIWRFIRWWGKRVVRSYRGLWINTFYMFSNLNKKPYEIFLTARRYGPRPACIARSPQIFGGPAQFRP